MTGRAIYPVETKVQNDKTKIKEIKNKITSCTCTCVLYNQNNLILTDKNNKELNRWITDFDSSKFKQSFIQSFWSNYVIVNAEEYSK